MSAILENIVDLSVVEIGKIVGVFDSGPAEESTCSSEAAGSPSYQVSEHETGNMEPRMRGRLRHYPASTAEHRNRRTSELT